MKKLLTLVIVAGAVAGATSLSFAGPNVGGRPFGTYTADIRAHNLAAQRASVPVGRSREPVEWKWEQTEYRSCTGRPRTPGLMRVPADS